ncbi:hypothetical protein PV08_11657 [Exophiala spinifera]|uniref:Amidase domain-containing protein n=1 Tax=Exophiala spinifera TaxID=91928 RepID=A0A0D2AVD7_9EURO|nr:uncharacterized protein PV08_11657 [Exophiala spinifera]KIW10693.1 hypothetical protein PV08_11657 [Exophiala spinifera]
MLAPLSTPVHSYLGVLLALWCALPTASSAQLSSRGTSLQLNDIDYLVSPYPSGNISVDVESLTEYRSAHGLYPVAVLDNGVGITDIWSTIAGWTSKDDVFQEAFAEIVVSSEVSTPQTLPGNGTSVLALPLGAPSTIPPGPYFLDGSDGTLYPVYRLYDDFAGAFTEALLQTPEGTFQTLSAQTSTSATLTIGVPSRLYYTPSEEKPLAGVRIAVKDLADLAGVKKSCGNRAWYNLYPPANETGTAIQRLIDAGAVIVGHQKLSQFANGETATADWVDYHSPFNPRGDGYQDPSSSSSGAGASIGSYSWLDIAVGSDTGGSIRGPAGKQGIFGNRPSHNLVSLDHTSCLSAFWCEILLSKNTEMHYPTQILTYNFPVDQSAPLYNAFANSLASFVSGNVTSLNITQLWASTGLPQVKNTSLPLYLNTTYVTLISKQQAALVRDPFFADYASVHDGRKPFVDPPATTRWAWGDSLPAGALEDALDRKTNFMNWFNTEVLPPVDDPTQCSSGLFLYGGSAGVPSYSNITQHVEYLPVAVDILAAKGCDGMLVRLAQDLVKAGILEISLVGQTIHGGDVLFKRHAEAAGMERLRYVG